MRKPTHVIGLTSFIVAGVVSATTWASGQAPAVVFQGLTHSAVGGAVLRVDKARDALSVSTFDPAGEDGVAVALRDATSWSARMEASENAAIPLNLSWHAIADSRRIASASMRRVGDKLELSAVFTGATTSTYTASVYANGRLVWALGEIPSTAHIVVPSNFCRVPEFVALLNCRMVAFHNTPYGCAYGFVGQRAAAFRLPNGTVVTGDELRLVEEVPVGGASQYLSFTSMVMQSNADLTLLSETAQ